MVDGFSTISRTAYNKETMECQKHRLSNQKRINYNYFQHNSQITGIDFNLVLE
jgi:hypothetical protein